MKLDAETKMMMQDMGFSASGKIKKAPKLYGAFVKINGKWQRRFDALAYTKAVAIKRFQNWLLVGAMGAREEGETERGLRPIK
jgi:hypothetical protein